MPVPRRLPPFLVAVALAAGCGSSAPAPEGVTEDLPADPAAARPDADATGAGADGAASTGGASEVPVSFGSGTVALFNGQDLSGWTAHWRARNRDSRAWHYDAEGNLVCQGKAVGYLQTDDTVADFVLELDWRFNPRTRQSSQGGILLRINGSKPQAQIWPRAMKVVIRENYTGDLESLFGMGFRPTRPRTNGSMTRKITKAESRRGDWNHLVIRLEQDVLKVENNGVLVNELTGVEQLAGAIGITSEVGEIQYRNVQLTPSP